MRVSFCLTLLFATWMKLCKGNFNSLIRREWPIPTTWKAVILAQISLHPNWKFSTLQSKFELIKHRNYITRWKALVASGGSKLVKLKEIDEETFKEFQQARSECKIIHDYEIRRWAIREFIKFPNIEFKASANWLAHFKRRHGIVSRKIQWLNIFYHVSSSAPCQSLTRLFSRMHCKILLAM